MEQHFIDNSRILKYHLNLINEAGINTALALGWRTRQGQLARFDALCRIGDMSGCSVLDAGCGTGDLRAYLDGKYNDVAYTGIDHMHHFLQLAADRYTDRTDTSWLYADISIAPLPPADFVLASGSLTYRSSEDNHLHHIIDKLYNCAHKALAFNLLSGLSDPNDLLCTYEPEHILAYCRTLCANAQLVEGYCDGDFTVWMRKE